MALSQDTYTASAAQTDFTVTFGYIAAAHVHVYVDSVEDTTYTWPNSTTIRLTSAATGGETVLIDRDTPNTARLVDFVDSTTLTAQVMDRNSDQNFYLAQEAIDSAVYNIGLGSGGEWDANGGVIENVADPLADQDAATRAWVLSVLVASGTVPPAANPGDDDKVLTANAGGWSWQTSTESGIADLAITTAKIADDAITTVKILNDAVTTPKIADDAITQTKIADNSIGLAQLAHGTAGAALGFDGSGNPAEISVSASPVGTMVPMMRTSTPTGWLKLQEGTIGDSGSGASSYAAADCEDLYTLLWNDFTNAVCPVVGGRGASAAADWAAGKPINLISTTARVIGNTGAASGLSTRGGGNGWEDVGEENHTLSSAEMPAHRHYFTASATNGYGAGGSNRTRLTSGTIYTSYTGSGGAHNNMQPTVFMKWFIKL